jgi:hypothetical protein
MVIEPELRRGRELARAPAARLDEAVGSTKRSASPRRLTST